MRWQVDTWKSKIKSSRKGIKKRLRLVKGFKGQTDGQKPFFLRFLRKSSRLSWNRSNNLTKEDLQFHLVWFRWMLNLFAFQDDTYDKRRELRKASVGNQTETKYVHGESFTKQISYIENWEWLLES